MGFLHYFYPLYIYPDRILKDGCISRQHFSPHRVVFADFTADHLVLGVAQREFIFMKANSCSSFIYVTTNLNENTV